MTILFAPSLNDLNWTSCTSLGNGSTAAVNFKTTAICRSLVMIVETSCDVASPPPKVETAIELHQQRLVLTLN